jgi:protein-tyrosine phosphatase
MSDFNFVTTRLATGGAVSVLDVTALIAAGITHIIDCQLEFDDTAEFVKSSAIVLWIGVADDGNAATHGPGWFGKGIPFALSALAEPRTKVYAHCAAGVNRGPSMCFAIMLALGFSAADAEATIRAARPQVGLAYKEEAIAAVPLLGYS